MHCLSWQYSAEKSIIVFIGVHDAQIGVRPLDHCIYSYWGEHEKMSIHGHCGFLAVLTAFAPYAGTILSPKESMYHHYLNTAW